MIKIRSYEILNRKCVSKQGIQMRRDLVFVKKKKILHANSMMLAFRL